MNLAPVLIFSYKRLSCLRESISSLKANPLAFQTDLYIFSDGWKTDLERESVEDVRKYIENLRGFKKVTLKKSDHNKGLAASIIDGVSEILKEKGRVIVLEDDLVVSPNFLNYMNAALSTYEENRKVFSISGYTFPVLVPPNYNSDVYFTQRASSWGWATWSDRWLNIDWEVKSYNAFANNKKERKAFNKMGSDLATMLDKQMNGIINSWAIRWCYHQFKMSSYSVYPVVSKVRNIGFGAEATHTFDYFNRFETLLDTSGRTEFNFVEPQLNKTLLKQFANRYSVSTRAKYKILNKLAQIVRAQ
ncbi:MAG: glycosyltransferase [Flavobacterium sp.]|nr:MAG: glycosyltransferase [Flavobacterium sp.]